MHSKYTIAIFRPFAKAFYQIYHYTSENQVKWKFSLDNRLRSDQKFPWDPQFAGAHCFMEIIYIIFY